MKPARTWRAGARSKALLAALMLIGLPIAARAQTPAVDRKAIVRQARAAYYRARDMGLVGLRATVRPNWQTIFDPFPTEPSAVKMLNGLHYTMEMTANGDVEIHPVMDVAPRNSFEKSRLDIISADIKELVSDFFSISAPFVLHSPFPEVDADYELIDEGQTYRLSYRDGRMVTTMSKTFVITEMKITAPDAVTLFRPQFISVRGGLLLSSYEMDIAPIGAVDKRHLSVQIKYQEANGYQLPALVKTSASQRSESFENAEFAFSNYTVTRR